MHVHRLSLAVIALYTITASSAPATTLDEYEELDARDFLGSSKNNNNGGQSSRTGSSSSSGQCQKTTARGIDFDVDIIKRMFGSSKPTLCGVTAAPTQQSCKSFSADEGSNSEQEGTSGGRTSNNLKRGFFGSSRTHGTQTNGNSDGYTPLDPKLGKKATATAEKILLALQKQSSTCDNAVELPLIDQVLQENTICQAFTYFSKIIQPSLDPFSKKAKVLMATWLEGPIALANGQSVPMSTAIGGSRNSTTATRPSQTSTATGSSRGSGSRTGGSRGRLGTRGSGNMTENTGQGNSNNFWKVEPNVYKSKKAIAVKALAGTSSTATSTTESTDEGEGVAEYLSNSEVQESEKAFTKEFATLVFKAIEDAYKQALSCGKKKDKSKIESQWAKVKSAKTLVQQGLDHYFEAMVTAAGVDDSEPTAEEPAGDEDGAMGPDDGGQIDPSDPENNDTLDSPEDPGAGTSTGDDTSDTPADGPDGLETQESGDDQQSSYGGEDTLGSESTGGNGGPNSNESDTDNEETGSGHGDSDSLGNESTGGQGGPDSNESDPGEEEYGSGHGGSDSLGSDSTGKKGGPDSNESDTGNEEYDPSQSEAGDKGSDYGDEYGSGQDEAGNEEPDSSDEEYDSGQGEADDEEPEEYGSSQGEAGDEELDSGSGRDRNSHGSSDEYSSESQDDGELRGEENSDQGNDEEESTEEF